MNAREPARHAVVAGVAGMLVAVLATWFQPAIVHHGWIVLAIAAGFVVGVPLSRVPLTAVPQRTARSEEHTSELQSRLHLVCRLLLEKKKKHNKASTIDRQTLEHA